MQCPTNTIKMVGRKDAVCIFLTGVLLIVLTGCFSTVYKSGLPADKPVLDKEGEVFLYLQPLPQELHPFTFTITEINLVSSKGEAIPLLKTTAAIKGKELFGVQKWLGSVILPPGNYRGLTLTIGQAAIFVGQTETGLVVPEQPLIINKEFTLLRGQALPLFLEISPEKLITAEKHFTPTFALVTAHKPPKNFTGFVSNSLSNLISVFHKKSMEIVGLIATGGGPKGMALDQHKGYLYVALSGDDAVIVIDVETGKIISEIKLRFGDEPTDLALTADGRMLLSTNMGSITASIIDTESLAEAGRINLESEPNWAVVGPAGKRGYILHALANSVSVVDLSRMELRSTYVLDEAPWRGAFDQEGSALYILTRHSPNLLVVEPGTLSVKERIFVGSGGYSIKNDPNTGLIYIGKQFGEIAVIDPFALMFIDGFQANDNAASMTIDNEENTLLVISSKKNEIQKINLVSKRKIGTLQVAEGSYAITVMGER